MQTITFTPGLQAIGNLFENKFKMDVDLVERQKKIEKENDILKFNNLAYSTISQITDENDLLDKINLLNQYAGEKGITNEVNSTITNLMNIKNKQIANYKEEKIANDLINQYSNDGGYKEYNGQILKSDEIFKDMLINGIDKKVALDTFKGLNDANLIQSVNNQGGKYIYSENLKSKGAESKGVTREIKRIGSKVVWVDNNEEVTSPYILDQFAKEQNRVISDIESRIRRTNSRDNDNTNNPNMGSGQIILSSVGNLSNRLAKGFTILKDRAFGNKSWTVYDPGNQLDFETVEDEIIEEDIETAEEFRKSSEFISKNSYLDETDPTQLYNHLDETLKNYYIYRKRNGIQSKTPLETIVDELAARGTDNSGQYFNEEQQVWNKYYIHSADEKEMLRSFAFAKEQKQDQLNAQKQFKGVKL